jgi:hypothetical protein
MINRSLLKLVARTTSRQLYTQQMLWSGNIKSSFMHMLYRSRGFAIRKVTHFTMEAIETIGLILIVSPSYFHLSSSLMISNMILIFILEGLIQAMRGATLDRTRIPVSTVAIGATLFATLWYGVSFNYLYAATEFSQAQRILIYSRIISAMISVYGEVFTAEINIKQRVYFPPLFNYLSVVLCCAYVGIADYVGGYQGFYILIGMAALTRIALSMTSVFYSLRTQRKVAGLRPKVTDTLPTDSKYDLSIIMRAFFIASHYLAPVAIFLGAKRLDSLSIFSGVVILKAFADSFIDRPFRAVYVDVLHAYMKSHWSFIKSQVNIATMIGLGFLLGEAFFLVALLQLVRLDSWFYWGLIAWAILASANRLLLSRVVITGLDRKLRSPVTLIRWLVIPTAAVILRDHPWVLVLMFASLELLILGLAALTVWRCDIELELEYVSQSKLEFNQESPLSIDTVLSCHQALRSCFQRVGLNGDFFLVVLAKSLKSPSKMRLLLKDLHHTLQPYDLCLAIDSKSILLWTPGVKTPNELRKTILARFPLVVNDVTPIDRARLLKHLALDTTNTPIDVESFQNDPVSLLTCLEIHVQSILPSDVFGSWWVPTPHGNWQSLRGRASGIRNMVLSDLKRQSVRSVFVHDSGFIVRHDDSTGLMKKYWILRPAGQLIAIYAVEKSHPKLHASLFSLSQRILARKLAKDSRDQNLLNPTDYFVTKHVLEGLSSSRRFTVHHGPVRTLGPGEFAVAETRDGYGNAYLLTVKNLSTGEKLEDVEVRLLEDSTHNIAA